MLLARCSRCAARRPLRTRTLTRLQSSTSRDAFRSHLLRLAWPERTRLAGGFALLAGTSAITLTFPKVTGHVMDACLDPDDQSGWTPKAAAASLFGLFAAQSVMVAARGRLFAVAGERVAARLRRETFDSLLTQHRLAFFDRRRTGELISRLASDCSSLQKLIVQDALGVVRAGLLVGGSCGMMLTLSPQLCAISVCSFPVAAGLSRWMGDKLRERQKGVQDALADAAAEAERAINGVRTVKLFAAEAEVCASYGGRVEAARAQAEDVGLLAAFNEAGVILALNSSMLAVLAVGGQLLVDGALSYGDLSAFLLYSMTTGMSASSVAGAYAELRRASGASERILQLLAPTATDVERHGARTLAKCDGSVEFKGVQFAYPPTEASPSPRAVLAGVDFAVAPGERVAIVGRSGSGKSTLAALLAGLYSPDRGRVLVGGVDVSELEPSHLRTELLSVVPQEPALLAGSLYDNIALGRPGASDAEVHAAAAAAGCAFADGDWGREVGERGLQLSGGEKQRVALARVLLRNTPIVLLDEFSSALDAKTEARLFTSLRDALAGRTLIVITHRASALELVDRVVELEDADGGGVVVAGADADKIDEYSGA